MSDRLERCLDPLGDGTSQVRLDDWYPRVDQTPWESVVEGARLTTQSYDRATPMKDKELVRFMLKANHGTPLRMQGMTYTVTAPRYIIRQLTRHQIGADANGNDLVGGWGTGTDVAPIASQFVEVSGRFSEFSPKYYIPHKFTDTQVERLRLHYQAGSELYRELRDERVIKGDARAVLSEAVYGVFKVSYNLQAFLHLFFERRPGGGAQKEATLYVCAMWNLAYAYGFQTILELWAEEKGLPYSYILSGV